MATVPSAANLNLGNEVRTRPDTTPAEGPRAELAFAGARIRADQQGGLLREATKIASDFSDAYDAEQAKIRTREDNINRTREFNNYFEENSNAYQRLLDNDMTSQGALESYIQELHKSTEKIIADHGGSAASLERLTIRVENQQAKFAAGARDAVDMAQQAMVDRQFSDDVAGIVARVITGEVTMAEALVEGNAVVAEYAEVASDIETFNQAEAMEGLIIVTALQRQIDIGNLDAAEALINGNPEVIQTLEPTQLAKIIRSIELQKIAKAEEVAKRRAEQDNILLAYGVPNVRDLPPELQMLYFTGQRGTPAADTRTNEQKNADALSLYAEKYGEGSPEYQNLERLLNMQGGEDLTPIQMEFNRLAWLRDNGHADSQEARILENSINEQDPEFMARRQLEADFPQAQIGISNLKYETAFLMRKVDEALMLATGADNIDEAIKRASDSDSSWWSTGNTGLAISIVAGSSDAAALEAALTPIRSNAVLSTMEKMRALSTSGATGLGAISEKELILLRDAAGSLDTRVPAQLLSTLLGMRENLPRTFENQRNLFVNSYAEILGLESEADMAESFALNEFTEGTPGAAAQNGSRTNVPVIRLDAYDSNVGTSTRADPNVDTSVAPAVTGEGEGEPPTTGRLKDYEKNLLQHAYNKGGIGQFRTAVASLWPEVTWDDATGRPVFPDNPGLTAAFADLGFDIDYGSADEVTVKESPQARRRGGGRDR